VNISPAARIRPDGSFARPERFTVRYRSEMVRYRVAFTGRFSGEGAGGTFRVIGRLYNRSGKKLKTTCDSGDHAWSAALLR
jgi:hypothetical protein